jgi:hypothetical protein
MNTHPYLRAYMAGVMIPSIFFLFVFAAFLVIRFVYNPQFPLEQILVFPLALVPALWGGWNVVYLTLQGRKRLPLGCHGALLPMILVPLVLVTVRALGFNYPAEVGRSLIIILPLLMIIYYLVWKFLVGFLNALLGVA